MLPCCVYACCWINCFYLKPGDAAYFDAFYAASVAAEDSNSASRCFQKLGEQSDQGFVGAAFHRGSLQADFDGASHFAGDFIAFGARLDADGKNDRAAGGVFGDLEQGGLPPDTVGIKIHQHSPLCE